MKVVSGLILLSLVMVLSAEGEGASGLTVMLRERVEIVDDVIRLGDIAQISGDAPHGVEKLRSVVIGNAPLPGKTRRIGKDYLMIHLKRYDIETSGIVFSGPEAVEVLRRSVLIPREKLENVVLNFIVENIPWGRDRIRVTDIRVSEAVILPQGDISYAVMLPDNMSLSGAVALAIMFTVNGEFKKKVWATARIEMEIDAVFTKRPVGRYQVITEDDLTVRKVCLSDVPGTIIMNEDEAVGKRAKRTINAEVLLRTDLLEFPPVVKRGDVVTIVAESGTLRVSTIGEVRQKGYKGEKIKVVNFDSKKEIYARVVDSNTVVVDF
ncbi:MAG: flagellar basal body P-ring formation protein FlgA [Deltaproteobacteria bacterium]|nr:flagellar basal body P-ring formation protein FlgA [Deltaproteobacteria bacterium]